MTNTPVNITILTGPTASGKTAHALNIAHDKNGVILNADSMQLYDALPILSAHPDKHELEAAPHKLYGILKAQDNMNAAQWTNIALSEIKTLNEAGQHPIFVGGTGFYITSLIKGLSPIPDAPPEIRDNLNDMAAKQGTPALYEELKNKDPDMASRLKPQDTQRIIRALEVLEATGKSLGHWQELPFIAPPQHYNFNIIATRPNVEQLNERINKRIDIMLEKGALDEVDALSQQIDLGLVSPQALITKALGFHAFQDHLKGKSTLDNAIKQTATQSRQYAKRQRTWARSQYTKEKLPSNATFEFLDI
jgi:tRNA dimethylallyltransferase